MAKVRSRQDRFSDQNTATFSDFFEGVYRNTNMQEPVYAPDSRMRDAWLRDFIPLEPNLHGIVNSIIDIDKNRGWRIVGGRNQVSRFTRMMHNFQAAPGLVGWRPAVSMLSKSFWGSNMGAIVELGRAGKYGPLRQLYVMDPTTVKLTGDHRTPLRYYRGRTAKTQLMEQEDFIRVCSMPSEQEAMNGLGRCAVDRAIELAKLMIAVYEHDREQLGSQAPRGLMLLKGVTQKNWETAMQSREAKVEGRGYNYFGPLAVLATQNTSADAKLTALSQLPVSFNLREWMDMLIFGYAVCFGYDASEFWPVQFGALGRGTETEIQHEKATGKGRLDFVLGFQEQLQRPDVWPDSLEFSFDQRDEKGDLIHAQVVQSWANVGKTLLESTLSLEEVRVLQAEWGIIPRSWAPSTATEGTDLADADDPNDEIILDPKKPEEEPKEDKDVSEVPEKEANVFLVDRATKLMRLHRDTLRSRLPVRNAAMKFPNEPVVEYIWPDHIEVVLWESGHDLLKPQTWSGFSPNKKSN
jgi:hypothetical protein